LEKLHSQISHTLDLYSMYGTIIYYSNTLSLAIGSVKGHRVFVRK